LPKETLLLEETKARLLSEQTRVAWFLLTEHGLTIYRFSVS
jgi:hypothetical protein